MLSVLFGCGSRIKLLPNSVEYKGTSDQWQYERGCVGMMVFRGHFYWVDASSGGIDVISRASTV
jgi:hypothetical protein